MIAPDDPVEQFALENADLLCGDSAASLIYQIHISPRFRYAYVATPKVACSSIKATLQRLELGDTRFSRSGEAVHMRAYSPLLSPVQAGSFRDLRRDSGVFKFCFVRHPFTRLLSAYLDKIVRNKPQKRLAMRALGLDDAPFEVPISFAQFVLAVERGAMDPHWRPQVEHLRIGRLHYNFIGRFEELARDLDRVGGRIGVDLSPFLACGREHRTDAGLYLADYYSADLVERVARLYRDDLDYFGYAGAVGGDGIALAAKPAYWAAMECIRTVAQ